MAYDAGRTGYRRHPDSAADGLARGLGWFSIALGVAEVLAPRRLAATLGMEGYERLITAYGVREIVQGVGILASEDPTPWIWGRVAGDALDVATVTAGMSGDNPKQDNAIIALVSLLGVAAVDFYCANRLTQERLRPPEPVRDYSDRSGWPRPVEAMRGAAREGGFEIPDDMRGPPALRPYGDGREATSTSPTRH